MFDVQDGRGVRRFAAGLALLSLVALTVTAWILLDVSREQQIVARIIQHLPESDLQVGEELSGDLQLRSRLSFLLVINTVGTGIAFAIVVRAYLSSERSLRDAKVLATDILASMDAGVITTDRQGCITSMNPRGYELIGLSLGEAIGRRLAELNSEHELLANICDEVITLQNCIRDRDYSVVRHDHELSLRAGCTLLKNRRGDDIGTVLHVRDVTEKALMEKRLRRMERFMGLGSLAAGLQHEIKNPLSALSLHLQLLSERMEKESPSPETEELVDILHCEISRVTDVLDRFRNYASVDQVGHGRVDVQTLIEKLVRFLRPQTKAQDVVVKVDLPEQALGNIEADSVQLEQVLLNLALNALDAMPGGGVLRFALDRQEAFLRVRVADTGHGIPAAIQNNVFDPYFTTRSGGTGMGLAICDKIVRQHSGSLEFVTGPEGTEFVMLLPMDENT